MYRPFVYYATHGRFWYCSFQDGKEAFNSWKPNLIYVQGGNTFWLYHCIEKGGWSRDIVNACTGDHAAVYCGNSAGAIIMGKSVATACWKVRGRILKAGVEFQGIFSFSSFLVIWVAMGRPFRGTKSRNVRGLERYWRTSPSWINVLFPTHERRLARFGRFKEIATN